MASKRPSDEEMALIEAAKHAAAKEKKKERNRKDYLRRKEQRGWSLKRNINVRLSVESGTF